MIIRSKAPLRIGLAGGGTDVSPFADLYGGSILNATINLYAHATIIPTETKTIEFLALDQEISETHDVAMHLPLDGGLKLLKGVYNRISKDYLTEPLSFKLQTHVDAPPGSGLGSSSTLVVAIIGAFTHWLKLPLGEYDIAQLAYEIERKDLGLAGGRQDQYAATFGGFNFMEFYKDEKVIVNPLRIKPKYVNELQHNIVLFYTGTSRESARIIDKQASAITNQAKDQIEATLMVKEQSVKMKEALLRGELDKIGDIMNIGWESKKLMAEGITNSEIESMYNTAISAGASGGKISGAGGGGFMFFYCPDNTRYEVIKAISKLDIKVTPYEFAMTGLYSYSID
ncbi:MAG: D-glycero-alpha-D-manno-heptose-7-phosphate kinase [Bacteroidia bacterium]|jgi:D-glycero-alpha-D-manno-heptose-7-phosphate kinase